MVHCFYFYFYFFFIFNCGFLLHFQPLSPVRRSFFFGCFFFFSHDSLGHSWPKLNLFLVLIKLFPLFVHVWKKKKKKVHVCVVMCNLTFHHQMPPKLKCNVQFSCLFTRWHIKCLVFRWTSYCMFKGPIQLHFTKLELSQITNDLHIKETGLRRRKSVITFLRGHLRHINENKTIVP